MTSILAIDPGPTLSAYVDLAGSHVLAHGKVPNVEILAMLRAREPRGPLVVEMIAPYGKPVGREVFSTCLWIGRYLEAWRGVGRLLERKEVKRALGLQVGHRGSTDADVRAALIRRWGGAGGKRAKAPEALAGIFEDQWAALAVAVAWQVRHAEAFDAVEAAPLSDLEDLNRMLGLTIGATQQDQSTPPADPVCHPAHEASRREQDAPIPGGAQTRAREPKRAQRAHQRQGGGVG